MGILAPGQVFQFDIETEDFGIALHLFGPMQIEGALIRKAEVQFLAFGGRAGFVNGRGKTRLGPVVAIDRFGVEPKHTGLIDDLEALAFQKLRIRKKGTLPIGRSDHNTAFALGLGIVEAALKQRLAVALFREAPRYPKAMNGEPPRGDDGAPSELRRGVFDEDLSPDVEFAEDEPFLEAALEPAPLPGHALGMFRIPQRTAEVMVFDVARVQVDVAHGNRRLIPQGSPAMRRTRVLLLLLSACATSAVPAPRSAVPTTPRVVPEAPVSGGVPRLQQRADLLPLLRQSGFDGSFVSWIAGAEEGVCVGDGCGVRLPVASTYKVPHALIALDAGVLSGADHVLPWDGQERSYSSWNQDLTLGQAVAYSAVWYFREVARRLGPEAMQEGLDRLEFGNRNIGTIDAFWLDGTLQASPEEQVVFWHRLMAGSLRASETNQDEVRGIALLEDGPEGQLYGKTGWYTATSPNVGWFVGCRVHGQTRCFALALKAEPGADPEAFLPARKETALRLVAALESELPLSD